ncbi:ABC transporter permease [Clostridium grantii]|uniref:ABC-2 family transporter protein n=1 Tax=Clostridium grantii DSM 8605 TaxID=1121316 RepID=A0A1M5VGP4_9CLOT|nr:ABC transporter permease [Clostridium grantii]SHH74103.1 ABC-2 family transporter protein [Clostridium grantii DSM 8605]
MKRRQFINAIMIKFHNLMDSIAVKLCLCITLLISLLFSFWPFINNNIVGTNQLNIYTNFTYDSSKIEDLKEVSRDLADVEIIFENDNYHIKVHSDDFNQFENTIMNIIREENGKYFIEKYNGDINQQDMSFITNQNINIEYDKDIQEINNEINTKLMIAIFIFLLMIIILTSRIGAGVAYEKGNQITEVILTSISRTKLFYTEIISGFFVVLVNMMLVMLPMCLAFFIRDDKITMDFSFFSTSMIVQSMTHLSICIFSLVLLSIGLSSLSKRPEDSNAATIIVMIPLYVSFIYSIFYLNFFAGFWSFLNYIPMFSIFNILSVIVNKGISMNRFLIFIGVDIVVISLEIYIMKALYCKNISKE